MYLVRAAGSAVLVLFLAAVAAAQSAELLASGLDFPSYEDCQDGVSPVFVRLRVTDGDLDAVRDPASYRIEIAGAAAPATVTAVEPKTERQWDVVVAVGPRYAADPERFAHLRALLPAYLHGTRCQRRWPRR